MKEQLKRILSAAAALCLLPTLCAPVTGAAFAGTGSFSAADCDYTDSAKFEKKVQSIIDGDCGLFADFELTVPVALPVGSALNTWQTYFVPNGECGWSGMQCYIYSQGVYSALFGAMAGNGDADSERARTVLQGVQEITPEILRSHHVMPGAYLRTTVNEDLSFNGNCGHSLIILGYDGSSITCIEGNADGCGAIEMNTLTYEQFNDRFTTGRGRGVCHVIQPDADIYQSLYGMQYETEIIRWTYADMNAEDDDSEDVYAEPVWAAWTTTTEETTVTTTTEETTTEETTTTTTTEEITTTTEEWTTAVWESLYEADRDADDDENRNTTTTVTESDASDPKDSRAALKVHCIDEPIVLPVEDPEEYIWSSSDPDVVSVIWNGIVVPKSNGYAMITAMRGSQCYEFPFNVQPREWEKIGDVNGDGVIDPMDAILVMNAYVDSTMKEGSDAALTAEQMYYADVDGNGSVDLVDAQLILQYYVNITLADSDLSAEAAWASVME